MPRKKRRTYNVRRIRSNMSYSVQEVAELFKLHKNAVLNWIKDGLKIIDQHKPYLIYGSDLVDFLRKRKGNRKYKCQANEFFCCRCRQPRRSTENQVRIEIRNQYRLKIYGKCSICGTWLFRAGATKKLHEYLKIFNVHTVDERHIVEGMNDSVNSDIKQEPYHEQIPS